MSTDYIEEQKSYIRTIYEQFKIINSYNTTIAYIGFASFFFMANYVKDQNLGNKTLSLIAIISMSISIAIFTAHEVWRALFFSDYTSKQAVAIESLPEKNPLKLVNDKYEVNAIRFQKYNKWFFTLSVSCAIIAIILMFINYFIILCSYLKQ
ncbi:hypothetical protein P0136_03145 [Lentisphaerota bacterium ZTH]|nr:hypothetical protein JYG24_05720 [Lentisphaerota bacterium]WET06998.1 hypothetical protein P0136_03145 [Lentisphaerota bacterium ZTH]